MYVSRLIYPIKLGFNEHTVITVISYNEQKKCLVGLGHWYVEIFLL